MASMSATLSPPAVINILEDETLVEVAAEASNFPQVDPEMEEPCILSDPVVGRGVAKIVDPDEIIQVYEEAIHVEQSIMASALDAMRAQQELAAASDGPSKP